MSQLTFEQKYEALSRRDPGFVGLFFTAVKTTGIFCRPTCSARTPRAKNVEFFDTAKEALLHGYRPCKVCKPMEKPHRTPDDIESLIRELDADPSLRLRDADLRLRGVEPSAVRRWFKRHHNMTFHAYQRMLRLNRAYRELSNGKPVATTAYDSGYESLSGFTERFRTTLATQPSRSKTASVIHLTRFSTPLGPMFAGATDNGVCLCEFTERRMLETEFTDLQQRLGAVILPSHDNAHLLQLQTELTEYFDGVRQVFDVALDTPTTPFRQRVWDELCTIPFGETISYAQLAKRLDHRKAVRAVGSANGHNRVAIVIPCHRVIGSSGKLTGYGGGLARKQWLLDWELNIANAQGEPKASHD